MLISRKLEKRFRNPDFPRKLTEVKPWANALFENKSVLFSYDLNSLGIQAKFFGKRDLEQWVLFIFRYSESKQITQILLQEDKDDLSDLRTSAL